MRLPPQSCPHLIPLHARLSQRSRRHDLRAPQRNCHPSRACRADRAQSAPCGYDWLARLEGEAVGLCETHCQRLGCRVRTNHLIGSLALTARFLPACALFGASQYSPACGGHSTLPTVCRCTRQKGNLLNYDLCLPHTVYPDFAPRCVQTIGCHLGHVLEFVVALVCYLFLWPATFPHAGTWAVGWVSKVVAFNLVCEFTFVGFWHWLTYASG